MGMDVIGQSPKSECGKYFGRNCWSWHTLANYIQRIAPDIAAKCEYWHSNDGEGLSGEDSIELAELLTQSLGAVEVEFRGEFPDDDSFEYFVESIEGFILFLRESGGFEIW